MWFGWLKCALGNIQRQLASLESWQMGICARLDRIEKALAKQQIPDSAISKLGAIDYKLNAVTDSLPKEN